jgi:hypothetical protein
MIHSHLNDCDGGQYGTRWIIAPILAPQFVSLGGPPLTPLTKSALKPPNLLQAAQSPQPAPHHLNSDRNTHKRRHRSLCHFVMPLAVAAFSTSAQALPPRQIDCRTPVSGLYQVDGISRTRLDDHPSLKKPPEPVDDIRPGFQVQAK